MPKPNELALDHLFWMALSGDANFRLWFLSRTKFADPGLELVTDEKWHQRWYRDPETKKDSETDILVMLRAPTSEERFAIHVENKPDHRAWESDQAANYRRRAINRMGPWRYTDFQTMLLAPRSFLARWPDEATHFDVCIAYEEVGAFIPEFAAAVPIATTVST